MEGKQEGERREGGMEGKDRTFLPRLTLSHEMPTIWWTIWAKIPEECSTFDTFEQCEL